MTLTSHPDFVRGAELFNAGHWWEAHEAWEAVWMHSSGDEKLLVQGLILLAAALHKRWHGGSLTHRNYHKALAKLENLPGEYYDIQLDQLKKDVWDALQTPGLRPQLRV